MVIRKGDQVTPELENQKIEGKHILETTQKLWETKNHSDFSKALAVQDKEWHKKDGPLHGNPDIHVIGYTKGADGKPNGLIVRSDQDTEAGVAYQLDLKGKAVHRFNAHNPQEQTTAAKHPADNASKGTTDAPDANQRTNNTELPQNFQPSKNIGPEDKSEPPLPTRVELPPEDKSEPPLPTKVDLPPEDKSEPPLPTKVDLPPEDKSEPPLPTKVDLPPEDKSEPPLPTKVDLPPEDKSEPPLPTKVDLPPETTESKTRKWFEADAKVEPLPKTSDNTQERQRHGAQDSTDTVDKSPKLETKDGVTTITANSGDSWSTTNGWEWQHPNGQKMYGRASIHKDAQGNVDDVTISSMSWTNWTYRSEIKFNSDGSTDHKYHIHGAPNDASWHLNEKGMPTDIKNHSGQDIKIGYAEDGITPNKLVDAYGKTWLSSDSNKTWSSEDAPYNVYKVSLEATRGNPTVTWIDEDTGYKKATGYYNDYDYRDYNAKS